MKITFGLVIWWLLWLGVSIRLEGDNFVSEKVVVLIAVMCAGLLAGSSVGVLLPKLNLNAARGFNGTLGNCLKSVVALQFIWVIYIYVVNKITFLDVRSLFFYEPQVLGGHKFTVYLYSNLVVPIYIYINCYFLAENKFSSISKISLLFACLDVLICAGRFMIYYFVFFQAYSVIKDRFERAGYLFIGITALLILSFGIYTLRYGSEITFNYLFYIRYFETSVIYYHTAPFYLLSKLLEEYRFEYSGFMSFGFADYVFHLLFPWLGKSEFALIGGWLNDIFIYIDGNPYNAFSTSIFPVYQDFKIIGVFIYFSLMGFIVGWRSKLSRGKGSVFRVFIVFILFFGLFMPINTSSVFFVTLFFVITSRLLRVQNFKSSTS
jgi:oligosaccharide repeat unit polymerase